MNRISRSFAAAAGFIGGVINGLFGAGGGAAAVPMLEAGGLEPKKSHALTVGIMMFVSMVSAVGCIILGDVPWGTVRKLVLPGIAGSAAGAFILRRTDNDVLRRIFGAFLIMSGIRMLIRSAVR